MCIVLIQFESEVYIFFLGTQGFSLRRDGRYGGFEAIFLGATKRHGNSGAVSPEL
jgi:hypothetical protein